jgi:hypothetical protein
MARASCSESKHVVRDSTSIGGCARVTHPPLPATMHAPRSGPTTQCSADGQSALVDSDERTRGACNDGYVRERTDDVRGRRYRVTTRVGRLVSYRSGATGVGAGEPAAPIGGAGHESRRHCADSHDPDARRRAVHLAAHPPTGTRSRCDRHFRTADRDRPVLDGTQEEHADKLAAPLVAFAEGSQGR